MAYRDFDETAFSRRALLRGSAMLGAGAAMSALPFGGAFARDSAVQWKNVRALIDSYVDTGKLANMVAVVGMGQRAPTVIAEGPLTIGQPVMADIDSLYRVYSMTKPITGMAAMMLIDQGKLGLDQPIADFLPKFANMKVQKTYDGSLTDLVPAERQITVRHLMTHTAGLGYGIIQKGPIRDAYAKAGLGAGQVSKLPIPGFGNAATNARGLAEFADRLAELPLVYQPGTHWSYSVGLDLLGRVIELASGQKFDTFLDNAIFKPAGITSTFFTAPKNAASRLTTNYGAMGGALLPIDPARTSIYLDTPSMPYGGSGLVSSPRDYDRFLRMLLGYGVIDGKRVMGELAVRVGTSNLLPEGVKTAGTFAQGQGFGAGGRVGIEGDQKGQYGWGGAAGTVAAVDMRRGLRASLFTQYMPSDAYPIHSAFPEAVAKDIMAMAGA